MPAHHLLTLRLLIAVFVAGAAATAGAADKPASIPGVGPVGEIKKLAGDLMFTEGPASDGRGNVFFSDIPANKIYQLDAAGKLTTFLEPSNHTNGLMFNSAATLYACEMDGRLVAINRNGMARAVASGYEGKRFNAPNDLVLDQQGGVYLTDPRFRAPDPLPQGKEAVYYVAADGKVSRLIDNLPAPNGVILSTDEKTLYVVPTMQKEMMAYPVLGAGKLGEGKVFCTLQQPEGVDNTGGDGLTIDAAGNLYITSRLGLQVFNKDGKLQGIIAFPEQPANVTFGGQGNHTLYVTARTGLYSVQTEATGHVFTGPLTQ